MIVITKETQQRMTPEEALERLAGGNDRFINNKRKKTDHPEQVQATRGGQYPFAAVLGCIDSRVPAELIFDQGIGDLFNARVAGNIVNKDILGSLEYSCKVAGSKLILVLGHTSCGAVTAACRKVELGNITHLLSRIRPAVESFNTEDLVVDEVARKNVQLSMEQIRKESPILAEMEQKGEIMIRGAMYDISDGRVTFLD